MGVRDEGTCEGWQGCEGQGEMERCDRGMEDVRNRVRGWKDVRDGVRDGR